MPAPVRYVSSSERVLAFQRVNLYISYDRAPRSLRPSLRVPLDQGLEMPSTRSVLILEFIERITLPYYDS